MNSYERSDLLMGTVISQKAWGTHAKAAMAEVYNEMNKIDRLMSSYKADSDVAKINRAAGIEAVTVDSATLDVIVSGLEYGYLTEGRFDITIAPLVKAWDVMGEHQRIPTASERASLLDLIAYDEIQLNAEKSTVYLPRKGQMIDLGGIAKGWACDRALAIYADHGVQSAMINMGGNVAVWGEKPDKNLWRIGVQNPLSDSGNYLGVVAIAEGSVVTSGAYQRFFEHEGQLYHHILDPKTGMPVQTDLLSATLVAPHSSDAEGLSTPVFMAGLKGSKALLSKVPGAQAILVANNGVVYVTEGLKNSFSLTEEAQPHFKIIEI